MSHFKSKGIPAHFIPSQSKEEYIDRQIKMDLNEYDMAIIAESEDKWRRVAEETHKRILANHYSPKIPANILKYKKTERY